MRSALDQFEASLVQAAERLQADDAAPERAGKAPAPRRARTRQPRRLRPLIVAGATGGLAAGALAVAGTFAGSGSEFSASAKAAILRGAQAALPGDGTIVIYRAQSTQVTNPARVSMAPGYPRPKHLEVYRWATDEAIESPTGGSGAQNELNLSGVGVGRGTGGHGVQAGSVDGTDELWDPATKTVYESSEFAADIGPGSRPGTYTYTMHKWLGVDPKSVAATENKRLPVTIAITAAQRLALLDGTATIVSSAQPGGKPDLHVAPVAPLRGPAQEVQQQLAAHELRVIGREQVNGREAIRLQSTRGDLVEDVAPDTYVPIRTVTGPSDGTIVTTNYDTYTVVPATAANRRRYLQLASYHPGAKVDTVRADYVAAFRRINGYDPAT